MTQTSTDHDNDLSYWANQLRAALARTEGEPRTERIRELANRAHTNHTLSVNLLKQLVGQLPAAPAQAPKAPRTNIYAQSCERCGKWVEVGEGVLERDDDDTRWLVSHPEGECPVVMFEGVPEGRYAIDWDNDDNVKFYQIKEGVLYAQASAELWEIKETPHVRKVLDAIKADPQAASILYGLKLEHCGVCGRKLTNKESRDRGIGPICADKMGW